MCIIHKGFRGFQAVSPASNLVGNLIGLKPAIPCEIIHLTFIIGYYIARSPKINVINVPSSTDADYQDWLDAGVALDQLPTGATQAFAYFSHGGINLAYMYKTEKVVFGRAGFRFGTGKLELTAERKKLLEFFSTSIFERIVFNINPEVGVGVNLKS